MQATHTGGFPTKQNHCLLHPSFHTKRKRYKFLHWLCKPNYNVAFGQQATTGRLPSSPTCIHLTVCLSYYVALDSLRSVASPATSLSPVSPSFSAAIKNWLEAPFTLSRPISQQWLVPARQNNGVKVHVTQGTARLASMYIFLQARRPCLMCTEP
jgi:hypothetical protein